MTLPAALRLVVDLDEVRRRHGAGFSALQLRRLQRRVAEHRRQRQPPPGRVVLHALQHQRAAVALGAGHQLGLAQPQRALDALVQRAPGNLIADRAAD